MKISLSPRPRVSFKSEGGKVYGICFASLLLTGKSFAAVEALVPQC
ncbi:MAG: hypothetical protein F6K41_33730 [Symploca sp. SIO3E6]|nr:hypothetical protein [Caldora sp. SIO3E6]